MAHSIDIGNETLGTKRQRSRQRKNKPYPDFPLFWHPNGQWCKKIKGRHVYFGSGSAEQALKVYEHERDALYAGVTPAPVSSDLTVKGLCDRFLTDKKSLIVSDELSRRTFQTYYATCLNLANEFGRNTRVADLKPDDFTRLRQALAKRLGPVALGNEIQRVRSVFKYAVDQDLIEKPIKFGQLFKKPPRKRTREHRNEQRRKNGKRMFEPAEIRTMLEHASPHLRAMIMLAVNGGLGNTDIAELPVSCLNLDTGWCDYPRPKTQNERRFKLWPETVAALRTVLEQRSSTVNGADAELVFRMADGRRWVTVNSDGMPCDYIAKAFDRLLKRHGLKREQIGFYALRRSYMTAAELSLDFPAIAFTMGHADSTMADHYREAVWDKRLQAVADCVHAWLFPADLEGGRDAA